MVDEVNPQFESQEWILFSTGLGGIFLGTILLALFDESVQYWVVKDTVLGAAALTVAVALLLGVLYLISVKHNHPRLHRVFFLISSLVVGTGVFMLMLSALLLFFTATQLMLYTLVSIILISTVFALSIIIMELTYVLLRRRYESIAPKKPALLFEWGAIMFATCFVLLMLGAWWANTALVNALQRNALAIPEDLPPVPEAYGLISSINNTPLKQQLLADQKEATLSLTRPTLGEVLTDKVFASRCQEWASFWSSVTYRANSFRMADDYTRFKSLKLEPIPYSPPEVGVAAGIITLPLRYKPAEDVAHCTQQIMEETALHYDMLVGDQSTPEQREIAHFLTWRRLQFS